MSPFTVTWAPDAQRNLTELCPQNPAIRVPEVEDIRRVVRPPIAVLYKVREADRIVKVLWVKLWDE